MYVADAAHTMATGVAVKDDKIIAVGSDREVNKFIGAATRVIELKGRLMVPGLIDAHVHAVAGAINASKCSLEDKELTVAEMRPTIKKCLAAQPKAGQWLEVVSVNPSGLQATAKDIDSLVSDRPAYFAGSDGHTGWLNTAGLANANITAATKDPEGGKVERDATGKPTGKLIDAATGLVAAAIPQPTTAEQSTALSKALVEFNALGITSMRDPAVDDATMLAYEQAQRDGKLSVRVATSMLLPDLALKPAELVAQAEAFADKHRPVDGRLSVDQVKVFADGVIEAPTWTAAMLTPYLDQNGKPTTNSGDLYYDPELFKRQVAALEAAGISVHVHAIGDRAVRTALDAFEYAKGVNGDRGLPNQIVHLQVVDPADSVRFAKNNVIAGFQADWAFREAYTVEALEPFIGAKRYASVYPLKTVADTGAILAGGSDWPVSTFNPFQAMQRAVTRRDTKDAKPLGANQAITIRQALDMYTRGAASSLPYEGLGVIAVGNQADLAVLSQNILTVDPSQIENTVSQLTVLDGKVVHGQP